MGERLYLFKGREWNAATKRLSRKESAAKSPVDEYLRFIYECKPCYVKLTDIRKSSEPNDKTKMLAHSFSVGGSSFALTAQRNMVRKERITPQYISKSLLSNGKGIRAKICKVHSIQNKKEVTCKKPSSMKRKYTKVRRKNTESSDNLLDVKKHKLQNSNTNIPELKNDEPKQKIQKNSVRPCALIQNLDLSIDREIKERKVPSLSISRLHLQTTHKVEKPGNFKCNFKYCRFGSDSRNIIASHIYIHLRDIPFQCQHCFSAFGGRNECFDHSINVHTNQKPKMKPLLEVVEAVFYEETQSIRLLAAECFCCALCYYTSCSIEALSNHLEIRHGKSIEYKCNECTERVLTSTENVEMHFALAHPSISQPVIHSFDFYEATTTIQKSKVQEETRMLYKTQSTKAASRSTVTEADSTVSEAEEVWNSIKDDSVKCGNDNSEVLNSIKDHSVECGNDNSEVWNSIKDNSVQCGNDNSGDKEISTVQRERLIYDTAVHSSNNDIGIRIEAIMSLRPGNKTSYSMKNDAEVIEERSDLSQYENIFPDSLYNKSMLNSCDNTAPSLEDCTCSNCNVHSTFFPAISRYFKIGVQDIEHLFHCSFCVKESQNKDKNIYKMEKKLIHGSSTDVNKTQNTQVLKTSHKTHEAGIQASETPVDQVNMDCSQFNLTDISTAIRLIEIHADGIHKFNELNDNELAINICSKCRKDLPGLFFIYEHIMQEHSDFFENNRRESNVKSSKFKEINVCLAIKSRLYSLIQRLLSEKSSFDDTSTEIPNHCPLSKKSSFESKSQEASNKESIERPTDQTEGKRSEPEDEDVIFIGYGKSDTKNENRQHRLTNGRIFSQPEHRNKKNAVTLKSKTSELTEQEIYISRKILPKKILPKRILPRKILPKKVNPIYPLFPGRICHTRDIQTFQPARNVVSANVYNSVRATEMGSQSSQHYRNSKSPYTHGGNITWKSKWHGGVVNMMEKTIQVLPSLTDDDKKRTDYRTCTPGINTTDEDKRAMYTFYNCP